MLQGVKFNYHFGWVRGLIPLLPKAVGMYLVPAGVMDMLDFRKVNPPRTSNLRVSANSQRKSVAISKKSLKT